MSVHKSLVRKGSLVRSRNVLTRFERIVQLKQSGKWTEDGNSPFGLAKVRVLKVKKRVKEKKAKEEAPAGAAVPAPSQAAASPAAAKGAAAPAARGTPQATAPAAKK